MIMDHTGTRGIDEQRVKLISAAYLDFIVSQRIDGLAFSGVKTSIPRRTLFYRAAVELGINMMRDLKRIDYTAVCADYVQSLAREKGFYEEAPIEPVPDELVLRYTRTLLFFMSDHGFGNRLPEYRADDALILGAIRAGTLGLMRYHGEQNAKVYVVQRLNHRGLKLCAN